MQKQEIEITKQEAQFYGEHLPWLTAAIAAVQETIHTWRRLRLEEAGEDPLLYTTARIKSADSMRAKLLRLGKRPTAANALTAVHDAAGVRAICLFGEEVYRLAEALSGVQGMRIVQAKDYIAQPKPSGYRSYHLIAEQLVSRPEGRRAVTVEIQLRTVAMDTWAALEHEIQYKQDVPEREFYQAELKRCADEIASTELSLQNIRELIAERRNGHDADIISRR